MSKTRPRVPTPPEASESPRATVDFDVEALIKAGNIAHIEDVDGELVWNGDESWPVFLGYPFVRVDDRVITEKVGDEDQRTTQRAPEFLGNLPWDLKVVRKDPPSQCWVYVRAGA